MKTNGVILFVVANLLLLGSIELHAASAPLTINCPSNILVSATSSNGAIVFFTVTTSGGGGLCGSASLAVNPPSGSTFPIGTTTVTATATNNCTNTYCGFTVTVVQSNCLITVNCPSNIVVTAFGPTNVFFGGTASDSCGGLPGVIASPPSGSTFPIGTTTVTNTAYDANGTNTCSFTVTVNLATNPPTGSFPNVAVQLMLQHPDSSVEDIHLTGPMTMTSTVGTNGQASGTTSNGLDYVTTVMTSLNLSGTSLAGPVTVILNSNAVSSGAIIENVNNTAGVLDVPPFTPTGTASSFFDVFMNITVGGVPMVPATPPYFDGTITYYPFGQGDTLANPETIPLLYTNGNPTGYYLVGGQLTASPGTNTAPILLTCSSNLTVTATEPGGASVFFTVTASGGCSALNINSYPASGGLFPIGATTVYTTASDDCGDSTNCSFTVTVIEPPIVLNCSSNLTVAATGPGDESIVFFNVTASGGCDGSPSVSSYPPSGSVFPLGTTVVTSTASDSCGGSTNCNFTITVTPPPPIVLNCSSNVTVTATGPGGATVFYSVTASGGCSPPTINAYPPSGSTFAAGTTTVFVNASDACGNSTNCSFVVKVAAPPIVLNCASNVMVTASSAGGATVFFSVTASGGCSTPTVSAYPPSGSTFPVGVTTVYTTATDGCGTSTNCSFLVTVLRPPMVLNCASNVTVMASSPSGVTVFYSVTASGGCSTPTVSAYPPSGSTFPVGVTTVYTAASDGCGTSTNCSFVVTVSRPPIVLNCASNITLAATSSNGAIVFYSVTASGGCSTPAVRAYPPSGSTFPVGVTTVYTTATDTCDTFTNCSFTVTVTSTNPAASVPRLSIRLTGTNQVTLAWPTNTALTYSIAQIWSLGGTNWMTLSNPPTVVGSSNQVVLGLTNPQSFFRLTSPSTNTAPCVVSLTLTNCDLAESVFLTPPASAPTVTPGNPVNLSATLNSTPGLVAVVSYYTNSTGYSPNCPDTFVTNLVAPTILSNRWSVQGPGSFTASGAGLNAVFTPTGCGSGTVHFVTTWQHVCDAGQSSTFVSGSFTVNCATTCLAAGVSTNCAVAGSMSLTNTTAGTNYCFGNAVTASVANLVTTNSQMIITTTYTNAAGAVTTNCPPTFSTNSLAPTIVSNWWTVSGPGSYTNSGAGLTAAFTPTNGGSGMVTFNLTYVSQTPCATNVQTAPPIGVPFNVIQITNITTSFFPTNETRLLLGVGERVLLSLAGDPGGNYTWSTTAGSVSPTNGIATTFTAPSNAANATVSVNYSGGSCPLQFTVIEPAGLLASNTAIAGYGVNVAGAGMVNQLWLTPQTVSFYRVQTYEVPATSNLVVTGYFANTNIFPVPPGPPMHTKAAGAGTWVGTRQNNYGGTDSAYFRGAAPPWSVGVLTWPIPNWWRIGTGQGPGGPTNYWLRTDQTFSLDANGTLTVQKYGHTVTRGTNNVYSVVN